MPFPVYLLLFILPVIIAIGIGVYIFYKKNSYSGFYKEGVRNENDGRYDEALHNYEDALSENSKPNINRKLNQKIIERIKMLRTTIDFEDNFRMKAGSNHKK
jgi:CRISPR/Cas system-associated protein Cas5 (RAMP superfamily)